MRLLFFLLGLTICVGAVQAQEQEGKLVDRLLRPDMTLANSAQDKKFNGTGTTAADKKFVTRSYAASRERTTKTFAGTKSAASRSFQANKFTRAEKAAQARANAELAYANAEFLTRKSSLVRTSSAQEKVAPTRTYAESRPFLAKGTRQKILSQQDKPLTIDEIRELLNKSR
ncbi:hypothetical protein BH20VER3_BH20VER3_13420 [soil metagenome]